MMRKTPLKPGNKPMKRTAFRTLLKPSLRGSIGKTLKTWKAAKPKSTPIRRSARGEDCTLGIAGVCNQNPETTVWAHSNRIEDGKGMGIKARDEEGCYACSCCHAWLDGGWTRFNITFEMVQQVFDAARRLSQAILRRKGLI